MASTSIYQDNGIVNTTYSFFYTYNYTGNLALSSYALPFAEFVFVPRLQGIDDVFSSKRIVWDFGDGTISESVTGRHAYILPGEYKVICYLYDKVGESYIDSFSQRVIAYNYLTNNIILSTSGNLTLTAGKITNPIKVIRSTSYQSYNNLNDLSIIPFADGARDNYFDANLNKIYYNHLYPYSSFFLLEEGLKDLTEFVEISSFKTTSNSLYCKLSGNTIINCLESDTDSFFYGTSGDALVYFKSDMSLSSVKLCFGYSPGALLPFTNTATASVTASVVKNLDYNHLSITSNGLDAEGSTNTSFDINPIKFSNSLISFVIKVKDTENYTIKNSLSLNSTNTSVILTNGVSTFSAQFSSSSNFNLSGVFKGTFKYNTAQTTANLFLSARTTINGSSLTGRSSTFTIYPSGGVYNIAKHGEDIDMGQKFRDISFQSLFVDKYKLYNEFLDYAVGTISSDQSSLGKVTYEKITNFVSNNSVLDYSNVTNLIAILQEYSTDYQRYNSSNYNYPAELTRLIDILSINKSRLFGTKNQFSDNFYDYGYVNSDIYGVNLGDEISIYYKVTAGQDIVAYEKYSNTYRRLNTYQPVSAVGVMSNTYVISAYNNTWGWGLVIDPTASGSRLNEYYTFYKYITGTEGSIYDSVINFEDQNNTLSFNTSSYNDWSKENGVISNILSNQLYKGLQLIQE
jgi:hypothetical protein